MLAKDSVDDSLNRDLVVQFPGIDVFLRIRRRLHVPWRGVFRFNKCWSAETRRHVQGRGPRRDVRPEMALADDIDETRDESLEVEATGEAFREKTPSLGESEHGKKTGIEVRERRIVS